MKNKSPLPKLILMGILTYALGWIVIQNPSFLSVREYNLFLFTFGFTFGATIASIILKW